jgi:hypothetical protein
MDENDGRRDRASCSWESERSPQPRFLDNLARVQEEAGRLPEAIEYYRKFVASPGVDLELRDRAAQRLAMLLRINSTIAPTAQPDTATTPEPTPSRTTPERDAPPSDTSRRGRPMRNAGIGILSGGAALLVGGLVSGLVAQSTAARLGDTTEPSRRRDLVDRGHGLALATDVMISIGAALTVVGATLTAVGAVRMRRSPRRAAMTARPSARGLMVGITYRF